MNELMIFEGNQIEVFNIHGKVYFNPYDVGKCLGLCDSSVRMAMSKMNRNQAVKFKKSIVKDIDNLDIPTAGRLFLTESGVYKLIFKSNKPNAEKFGDWVADEVLPSIRATGKYTIEQQYQQTKIEEPYTYTDKYLDGEKVVTLRDIEHFTEIPPYLTSYHLRHDKIFRQGKDYYYLEREQLKQFKMNNPCVSRLIGSLIVVTRSGFVKLAKAINGMPQEVECFKAIEPPKADYTPIPEDETMQEIIKEAKQVMGALELTLDEFNRYNTPREYRHYQEVMHTFLDLLIQRLSTLYGLEVA
jgi:prophage antirepressor-like protein